MIRVGMPLPTFVRLYIRAQIAAQQARRTTSDVRLSVRLTGRNLLDRAAVVLLRGQRTPHSCSSEVTVHEFVERYEDLIDLLCWSANEGVKDHHRVRYTRLREWFIDHYHALRPDLVRYLPEGWDRNALCDPFESLFIPVHLDAVVNSDTVIGHITATRAAVETVREEMAVAA